MELDTKADIEFYLHLVDTLGEDQTDKVAPGIFSEDFRQLRWEITNSSQANFFYYKIQGENLVHQRDLSLGEDILTKINPNIRFGLEFLQMSRVKSRLLEAPEEAVVTWISPKKILDTDPNYPLDQINIAKKIDQETIWVKQLQGDLVNLRENQTLEDLMLNIGEEIPKQVRNDIFRHPELDSGSNLTEGWKYVQALKMGLSADSLRVKRAEILQETIPYIYSGGGSIQTSCGLIEVGSFYNGGTAKGPSWVTYNIDKGEFKCNFCWKMLPKAWLNTHRCICQPLK